EIAGNPPLVVHGIKSVLDHTRSAQVDASLRYVAAWNAAFLPSKDIGAAVAGIFERRKPDFQGHCQPARIPVGVGADGRPISPAAASTAAGEINSGAPLRTGLGTPADRPHGVARPDARGGCLYSACSSGRSRR